jgi:hypothetical protein
MEVTKPYEFIGFGAMEVVQMGSDLAARLYHPACHPTTKLGRPGAGVARKVDDSTSFESMRCTSTRSNGVLLGLMTFY